MSFLRKLLGCAFRIFYLFIVFTLFSSLHWIFWPFILIMFIPGLLLAWLFDKLFNPFSQPKQLTQEDCIELSKIVYVLSGFLAAGSGNSITDQKKSIWNALDKCNYGVHDENLFNECFEKGNTNNFDLEILAQRFLKITDNNRTHKIRFIEFLVSIIFADNVVTEEEFSRIYKIANALRVENYIVKSLIEQAQAMNEFRNFFNQDSSYRQYQESNSSGSSYEHAYVPHDEVKNAYKVLGVSENVTMQEIKRAYLKLMKRYHPDKLASQGYSEEMIQMYTKKAQTITQAYEILKKHCENK